jgi:hypothetical protein
VLRISDSLPLDPHLYFIYALYTWPEGNSVQYFNDFMHEAKFHGVEFSTCGGILLVFKKVSDFEF